MKWLTTFIVGIILGFTYSQDEEDYIQHVLETIVDNQHEIFSKFSEIKRDLMEEIVNLKEEIKKLKLDQCEEYQLCSRRDQVESFQEQFETGKEEIINSSRNQMTYVLDLLATDECLEDKHSCSEMASCQDKALNYSCMCHPGYIGDGFNCQDIDECSDVAELCGTDGTCINSIGSYYCTCEEGYKWNGSFCSDVDECVNNNCDERASCDNIPGSYQCRCLFPYAGDGFNCDENLCETHDALWVEGLGSISFIREEMTWDEAKDRCQECGANLLEDIEEEYFENLSQHFRPLGYPYPWVGLRRDGIHSEFLFTSGGIPVRKSSSLWVGGFPSEDGERNCGGIDLYPPSLGIFNALCSNTRPALCQRKE